MTSPAGIYDITADQGSTFSRRITWLDSAGAPIDLTGYTAKMQVRETVDSTAVILELSTVNSRISLGGAAGTIDLTASATVMTAVAVVDAVPDEVLRLDPTSVGALVRNEPSRIMAMAKIGRAHV